MPTKNPRRGYGEGFEYHRADDASKPTAIQIDRQLPQHCYEGRP